MKRRVLLSVLAATLVLAVSTQFAQAGFGFRLFAKCCTPCAPACEVTPCEPCAVTPCEPACAPCEPACFDTCCAPKCRPFAGLRAKFRCHLGALRARCCDPCTTACDPCVATCAPVVATCEPCAVTACEPACCDPCAPKCRPFAKLRARLASIRCCDPCSSPCDPCAVTACEPACF